MSRPNGSRTLSLRAAALLYFFVFSLTPLFSVRENNPQLLADEQVASVQNDNTESTQTTVVDVKTKETDNNDPNATDWFALVRENDVPVKLQVSTVSYEGDFKGQDGETRKVSVDLIGAIHFAEREYYEELNRAFANYDVVVYELVAPRGSDPVALMRAERETKAKASLNPLNLIPFVQQNLGEALAFVYQPDGVDYSAPNLKRGDLDTEDFIGLIFTNGDIGRYFSDMFWEICLQPETFELEGAAIALASASDRRLVARRLFALELERSSLEEAKKQRKRAIGEKETPEDVLIRMRNKKALSATREELAAGKTKIAIFYGAAHLADLGERLQNEFGLTKNNVRWTTAWTMEKDGDDASKR